MKSSEFIFESKTVTLNHLYDGETPDRDELIWNFVGKNDFNIPFVVRTIRPLDLEEMLVDQYGIDDIQDLFKKMQPDQENLIDDYANDPNLSEHIIVMSNRKIIDGNHRALAAVLSKRPIKYINVAEDL